MTLTDTRTAGNYTHRSSVDSSNLREVLFDAETNRLFVVFHSGSVAGYADVPLAEYERLVEADASPSGSVGRTYNQIFRQKRSWGGRPTYSGVVAPDTFVFRAPAPVIEDVTTVETINASDYAPWASSLALPEQGQSETDVRARRTFQITLVVEADSLVGAVNALSFGNAEVIEALEV